MLDVSAKKVSFWKNYMGNVPQIKVVDLDLGGTQSRPTPKAAMKTYYYH